MATIQDLPVESYIRKHFEPLIKKYRLKLENKNYFKLVGDDCVLHFPFKSSNYIEFFFTSKMNENFVYSPQLYYDLVTNNGYYSIFDLDASKNFDSQIEDLIHQYSSFAENFLVAPMNGNFEWTELYDKRKIEIENLLNFIFNDKNGREARKMLFEKNPVWELIAIAAMNEYNSR